MTATQPLRSALTALTAGIVPVDMDQQMEFAMVWNFCLDYQTVRCVCHLIILRYFET